MAGASFHLERDFQKGRHPLLGLGTRREGIGFTRKGALLEGTDALGPCLLLLRGLPLEAGLLTLDPLGALRQDPPLRPLRRWRPPARTSVAPQYRARSAIPRPRAPWRGGWFRAPG